MSIDSEKPSTIIHFKIENFVNNGETPRKGFCIVCGAANPTIHRRGVKGLSGTADFCTLPGHATWDLTPLLDLRWKIKKENEKKAKEAERQKKREEKERNKPTHWWSRNKKTEVIDQLEPKTELVTEPKPAVHKVKSTAGAKAAKKYYDELKSTNQKYEAYLTDEELTPRVKALLEKYGIQRTSEPPQETAPAKRPRGRPRKNA